VCLSRWELAEGTVRPGSVVVQQVFGQHLAQVVLVDVQKCRSVVPPFPGQPPPDLRCTGRGNPQASGEFDPCPRRGGRPCTTPRGRALRCPREVHARSTGSPSQVAGRCMRRPAALPQPG
jgi:hypothetical protein